MHDLPETVMGDFEGEILGLTIQGSSTPLSSFSLSEGCAAGCVVRMDHGCVVATKFYYSKESGLMSGDLSCLGENSVDRICGRLSFFGWSRL
jgi:hypothetical protein